MTLLDLIANPSNLSTIIEFMGLVGTIYLFFRKANEDNIKQVTTLKEQLGSVEARLKEMIENAEKRLCTRVTDVKLEVDKLENNFYAHIANGNKYRFSSDPTYRSRKEVASNGENGNSTH